MPKFVSSWLLLVYLRHKRYKTRYVMTLIAILAPWLSFLLRGKLLSAIVAFVIELMAAFTLLFFSPFFFVVWAILAVWAVSSYNNAKADKRNRALIRAMRSQAK